MVIVPPETRTVDMDKTPFKDEASQKGYVAVRKDTFAEMLLLLEDCGNE